MSPDRWKPGKTPYRIPSVNWAEPQDPDLAKKMSNLWRHLEWIVPVFLAGRMISLWLSEFGLLPDSTFYLCAAKNLLSTGRLEVYTNFPSFNFEPIMEIYSEYPPGFPFYMVPFVWISGDSLMAAAMAQGMAILGIFLVSVPLYRALGFHWVLRLAGYAFLAFLVSFREVFKILFSEPLFLWVTLGTFYFSVRAADPERDRKWDWILGGILLASGTAIKFIGVFNLSLWVLPVCFSRKRRWIKGIALPICAGLPAALWLGRNYLLFEKLTRTHLEEWSQDPRQLLDPFLRTVSVLAYNEWIVTGFLGFLLVAPFILGLVVKQSGGIFNRGLANHLWTLLGAGSHLVGIALLSVTLRMDFLDHRLLSASYLMFGIALLSALSLVAVSRPPYTKILLLLPFVYLGTNPSFRNPLPEFNLSRIEPPKHEELWKELNRMEELEDSSHFYTDIDFLHQLFCAKPHKIVWNSNYADTAEKTGWLLHYGLNPFFVVAKENDLVPLLEAQKGELGLDRRDMDEFVLFFHDSKPPPE